MSAADLNSPKPPLRAACRWQAGQLFCPGRGAWRAGCCVHGQVAKRRKPASHVNLPAADERTTSAETHLEGMLPLESRRAGLRQGPGLGASVSAIVDPEGLTPVNRSHPSEKAQAGPELLLSPSEQATPHRPSLRPGQEREGLVPSSGPGERV